MQRQAKARTRRKSDSARKTERREELLHVAAAVFTERGYKGASMREIARRWGVQQAALYYYFPSKEKILEAICGFAITQFIDAIASIQQADLPAEEKIRRSVRAHIEPLIEDRFYVNAFLFQRRELRKSSRRPLDDQSRVYEGLWTTMIEEGKREGAIARSLDTRLAVLAILGMCNTVARWSRSAADAGVDRVADTFAGLVCQGLFGESAQSRQGEQRVRARRGRR
jgi:AcrR family transcriptional regulator